MLRMQLLRTLLPWIAGCALFVPGAAFADTKAQLPKGYTSDELPALPSSQAQQGEQPNATVTPANDTEASDEYSDTDPSALTEFQQPLSPYGVWVVDPTYGTVWVPSATVVGADFAPCQTAGHWALDEDGDWLWVSDYEWGYIPFHYGRWVWISGRGWAWIPGRVYAPAWVVWRVGDEGYIGWAPMPPAYYWSGGVAVTLWVVPPAPYVFCSTTYVFSTHVHDHVIHDHVTVQQAARHTHPYKSANPSGSGTPHKAADPSGSGSSSSRHSAAAKGAGTGGASAGHAFKPASPSMGEAHIPAGAAPKSRVADAKALTYARRSTTPRSASRGGSFNAAPGQSRRGGAFEPPHRGGSFEAPPTRSAPPSGLGQPSAPSHRSAGPSSSSSPAPQAAPQSAPPVHAPSHAAPSRAPSRPTAIPPRAPAPAPRAAPSRPHRR